MCRPLVGITVRHEPFDAARKHHNVYPYDFQFTSYAERVAKAGGVPVWLPNVTAELDPAWYLERLDALVLSGGEDVDPRHYGEDRATDTLHISDGRDSFELPLVRAFWNEKRPILGICRGLQTLNVALGGTLYQDLSQFPHACDHRRYGREYARMHAVRIIPDSQLAALLGSDEFTVNTSHHQMIKDIADGLRAVAWSTPDGIIEAVEPADDRPVLALQWHPEMMEGEASDRLFGQLVAAVSR
jgi:putative glutamine amidotransferase